MKVGSTWIKNTPTRRKTFLLRFFFTKNSYQHNTVNGLAFRNTNELNKHTQFKFDIKMVAARNKKKIQPATILTATRQPRQKKRFEVSYKKWKMCVMLVLRLRHDWIRCTKNRLFLLVRLLSPLHWRLLAACCSLLLVYWECCATVIPLLFRERHTSCASLIHTDMVYEQRCVCVRALLDTVTVKW